MNMKWILGSQPRVVGPPSAVQIVAASMVAKGWTDYNPNSGVTEGVWNQVAQTLRDSAHNVYGMTTKNDPSYENVLAYVIGRASLGEMPDELEREFKGGAWSNVDVTLLIQTAMGRKPPNPFAPLPLGQADVGRRNVFGHWFSLEADGHSRDRLHRHAQAHFRGAAEMFRRRDRFYDGETPAWHSDGTTTQPRDPALARLEMEEILGLGLSEPTLQIFFVWWVITGLVEESRRLAGLYKTSDSAAHDAEIVFGHMVRQKPPPHHELFPVFNFKGEPLYFLNGRCVPRWLVPTRPEEIDVRTILSCRDPSARDQIAKKATLRRLCRELGGIIDEFEEYQLWGFELPDRRIRVLRIVDRFSDTSAPVEWWEGVPPECNTVGDAIRFRNKEVGGKLPLFIT